MMRHMCVRDGIYTMLLRSNGELVPNRWRGGWFWVFVSAVFALAVPPVRFHIHKARQLCVRVGVRRPLLVSDT